MRDHIIVFCLMVSLAGCFAGAPAEGTRADSGDTDPDTSNGTGGEGNANESTSGTGGKRDVVLNRDAGTVAESECNGIDDDGNGIVDDVDLEGDGVCDCLKVATLGHASTIHPGNVFAGWLTERSTNGAVALHGVTLTPERLQPYQVIVVQDVSRIGRKYSTEEQAALSQWVQDGGGLMTLIVGHEAFEAETETVNSLLSPFDVRYGTDEVLLQGGITSPVTEWAQHPVAESVSSVGMDNGRPVLGSGTVVARAEGLDVLHALEIGAGHVLVWGDEWITYDS